MLFVACLQAIFKKYSRMQILFSSCEGLIGALLIDAILFPSPIDYAFFVGWQTTMLLIITEPLLQGTR
ncbi:MAG: hypothetical protein DLM68_17195 [Hyphomicrobiales bacterium]|nr:MAG: hypothetical protein DLM68_17195 [Hyphomicrobiales bacterium]